MISDLYWAIFEAPRKVCTGENAMHKLCIHAMVANIEMNQKLYFGMCLVCSDIFVNCDSFYNLSPKKSYLLPM